MVEEGGATVLGQAGSPAGPGTQLPHMPWLPAPCTTRAGGKAEGSSVASCGYRLAFRLRARPTQAGRPGTGSMDHPATASTQAGAERAAERASEGAAACSTACCLPALSWRRAQCARGDSTSVASAGRVATGLAAPWWLCSGSGAASAWRGDARRALTPVDRGGPAGARHVLRTRETCCKINK